MPEAGAMPTRDFLFEIGTEELPPKSLRALSQALEAEFRTRFAKAELGHGALRSFATPRRLALLAENLAEKQPDRKIERFGPALAAAFDEQGAPTPAALGFARSCGVAVEELGQAQRQGATKLCYSKQEPGAATLALLPELAQSALAALPIPKRMRWGSSRAEFIRPVHWAVLLFGEEVVPASILGVGAGNTTFGHRFHCSEPIELTCPADYEQALETRGRVIADFDKRRNRIRSLVEKQVTHLKRSIPERSGDQEKRTLVLDGEDQIQARVAMDENLLDEVCGLVEYPVALTGAFDPKFLELPDEALILTLKHHQKCFVLEDGEGRLLPNFVAVSNIESRDPKVVIRGFERVIRPRLEDARFFFETDKARSLSSRRSELEKVVFQEELGTIADKSRRIASLSRHIAEKLSFEPDAALRAAALGKCDLVSLMVGEFAELQGLMGACYARNDGEPEAVATAIFEQYLPRHTGDRLPASPAGQVLALAEKLDTLAGLFAIGQPPTGSRDPFALRRAALGVLRILIEGELALDLVAMIDQAVTGYEKYAPQLKPASACRRQLYEFIFDRLRAWYQDADIDARIYLCVRAVEPPSPLDFHRRVEAVADFSGRPEAAALAAANKRVSNLLEKSGAEAGAAAVDEQNLRAAAETALFSRLAQLRDEVAPLFAAGNYQEGLTRLAGLGGDVDRFFDEVMVMVDEPALRANRLRLLRELRSLFLRVADISLL